MSYIKDGITLALLEAAGAIIIAGWHRWRYSRKASGQFWPRVWPRVWPGPARMGPELQRANDSDARDGRGGKCLRT